MYVDNCAIFYISNNISHFVLYKVYSKEALDCCSTVGGGAKSVGKGTVRWSWQDDNGDQDTYDLPDCKYFLKSPVCILSQTQLGGHLDNNNFGTNI